MMKDYHTSSSAGYRRKIVTPERLREIIQSARNEDHAADPCAKVPVFVQCHGCFDIVHPGHIRYLQFARCQGDFLIVSITGDAAVNKGDLRPYIPQELRAENLAAIEFVDYVVIDPNPTASDLLATLQPDVYVKGQEYATSRDPRFLEEKRVVESYGGRVLFSSGQVVFSSTHLGESLDFEQIESQRQAAVCARHGIDREKLRDLIDRIRGLRVLVFGDVYLEQYVLCDASAVASESPMMSLTELDRRTYFGGAALIAAQAAALGAKPVLISNFGDDEASESAHRDLESIGVRLLEGSRRPQVPLRTRFLVDDHKMLKVDNGGSCPMDSVAQCRVCEMLLDEAARSDVAILHDAGYGVLAPAMLQQAGPFLREHVPILCGGSSEPQGSLAQLRDLDLLCTSERRLRVERSDPVGGLSSLAYQVLELAQATQMLVTVGKRGVVTFDRHTHDRSASQWSDRLLSEYLPSLADCVVDRLGCGETMLTLSALALAVGASLMQAAYLGQAATAAQIATHGPTPITPDAVFTVLDRRIELTGASKAILPKPVETISACTPRVVPASTLHDRLSV